MLRKSYAHFWVCEIALFAGGCILELKIGLLLGAWLFISTVVVVVAYLTWPRLN